MSHVYITNTTPDGLTLSLRCGLCGWTGDVPAEQVAFPAGPDGQKDFRCLRTACGNCHATSTWPVSGGAAGSGTPELEALQKAFCHKLKTDKDHKAKSLKEGKAYLKAMLDQMGGTDSAKWALKDWNP